MNIPFTKGYLQSVPLDLLQATTENQFLRIMHTGEVLRSMRLTIKVNIIFVIC